MSHTMKTLARLLLSFRLSFSSRSYHSTSSLKGISAFSLLVTYILMNSQGAKEICAERLANRAHQSKWPGPLVCQREDWRSDLLELILGFAGEPGLNIDRDVGL